MSFFTIIKKCIGFLVLLAHPLAFTLLLSESLPSIPDKTLFIFTEPNDALMHFFPSILQSESPFLLCLSSGHVDQTVQSNYFFNICQKIGKISCIYDTNFTSEGSIWPEEKIKDIINDYIKQIKPQRIFTLGLANNFDNINICDNQISKAISYPQVHVGQIPIQKLSDLSLKYQNSSNQDTQSIPNNKTQKLNTPVYFLKSGPQFLKYSSYFGPLLYTITNSINEGFFVITPPYELISLKIRFSIIQGHDYNSLYMISQILFSRFFYFNHFLQQQLSSIET